jgi:DNA-binding LytR/AlgR family response regulator
MKTIIVDDEPKAIELLRGYSGHFKAIEVVATFRNGLRALEFLKTEKVDLVFLDINMPHLSGLALSRIIGPDIKIVFTTAYSEYAVESYEVEAVDYLLKPISFERFAKAVNKIVASSDVTDISEEVKPLLIKSGARIHRVSPEAVMYLEKDGNYITYHLKDQKIIARESIAEALKNLPAFFKQTHKSFIVNTREISFIEKDQITIDTVSIPIGGTFKEDLMKLFESG